MKVRIGISLGPSAAVPAAFGAAVDEIEQAGVDSLWLSEMVYGSLVEPFIGMAHALARTTHLKVGTGVAVLPGRHPVLVAKQLVTLAGLAPARVLPVFGLRPARRNEWDAFPVPPGRRADVFDESLRLLRMLVRQDDVSFAGEFFTVEGVTLGPRPAKPLDIWLGGTAPAALDRIGRLGDGWLGSFITPAEAGAGRAAIEAAAEAAGREVEPDHYGVSLAVVTEGIPDSLIAAARARRPDADPATLIAASWPDARRMIEQYVAGGLTKFVLRPASPQASLAGFLAKFVDEMLPLQS
jgi:probable F420-dependent oxidoreductase